MWCETCLISSQTFASRWGHGQVEHYNLLHSSSNFNFETSPGHVGVVPNAVWWAPLCKKQATTDGNGLGNDAKLNRLSTERTKQDQTTSTASKPSEPLTQRTIQIKQSHQNSAGLWGCIWRWSPKSSCTLLQQQQGQQTQLHHAYDIP
jgi:hypothetical protein